MSKFPNRLAPLVQRRLARFLERNPQVTLATSFPIAVQEIARIVSKNMTSERYDRFSGQSHGEQRLTPARYIDIIIENWLTEGMHWADLKNNKSQTWDDLATWLSRQAKKWFGGKGSLRGLTAEDFAQQAIVRMLKADYPFDVPFAPWALTILHREIWGEARNDKDVLEHHPDSLDEWRIIDAEMNSRERQAGDPLSEVFREIIQNREVLGNAMKQLSEPLFDVINLSYLEELTDKEIARKLNTTTENIQTRRHRALARLHIILTGKSMSGKRRH